MHRHHTTSAAAVRATPALDAGADAWLKMRLAPVCGAHRAAFGGTAVRDVLRTIASSRPDAAALALKLGEVRTLLERQRHALRWRLADGEAVDEIAHVQARLLDGTVIGLGHLGRSRLDRPLSVVPPLAVVARGEYGRERLGLGASADLLFLVPSDPVGLRQGLAIAQFVTRHLVGLGWQASSAKRTVRGSLAETHLDPAIASNLCAARLVWGCHGLFADLRAGLAQAMFRWRARTSWRAPAPCAGPVLTA